MMWASRANGAMIRLPKAQFIVSRSITSRSIRDPSRYGSNSKIIQTEDSATPAPSVVSYFKNPAQPPQTLDEIQGNQASTTDLYSSSNNSGNSLTTAAGTVGNGTNGGGNNASSASSANSANSASSIFVNLALIIATLALSFLTASQQEEIQRLQKEVSTTHVTLHKVLINYKKQMEQQQNKYLLAQNQTSLSNELTRWKLLMHIAILRKQLEDKGIDKIGIDQVLKDFEKNVLLNTKLNKVWLKDDSIYKKYIPDINDYDRK